MPDTDFTPAQHEAMLERLRAAQARKVMPLIGPLLDAWEQLSNDVRSDVELAYPPFVWTIEKIAAATEADA